LRLPAIRVALKASTGFGSVQGVLSEQPLSCRPGRL
jgi:hypothetical protein